MWQTMSFRPFSFLPLFVGLVMALSGISHTAHATTTGQSFSQWMESFSAEARAQGISEPTISAALSGLSPNDRVIELDRRQPEGTMSFATYRERVVNQTRINQGRQMMAKHADLLARTEERFGVAPQYIVALWGIETNFGGNTGGFDVIRSLATLAWEGRRADFFRGELLHALRIIDQGHIDRDSMTGSWAGALGQVQFMPSSFHNLAVDGDGDGKIDIWNNLSDAFASAANYLVRNGWTSGQRWGREVRLPSGFSDTHITTNTREPKQKTLAEWRDMGLTMPGGSDLPVVDGMRAYLVAPDGVTGPVYLVYDNYTTIMRWNRSTYFATSVGLLADAIARQ